MSIFGTKQSRANSPLGQMNARDGVFAAKLLGENLRDIAGIGDRLDQVNVATGAVKEAKLRGEGVDNAAEIFDYMITKDAKKKREEERQAILDLIKAKAKES